VIIKNGEKIESGFKNHSKVDRIATYFAVTDEGKIHQPVSINSHWTIELYNGVKQLEVCEEKRKKVLREKLSLMAY